MSGYLTGRNILDKELIKEVVKEMIRDGEIEVKTELDTYRIDTDDFGNSSGALESVELDIWLDVDED